MQYAARIAATLEILEMVFATFAHAQEPTPRPNTPADKIMERYFKARRFIGSKDRGAIAELAYWVLRHKATLEWWASRMSAPTPRVLVALALQFRKEPVEAAFTGEKYAPPSLSLEEKSLLESVTGNTLHIPDMPAHARYNYPEWLEGELQRSLKEGFVAEMEALQGQAAVDLRANTLKIARKDLIEKLQAEGIHCGEGPLSPYAVRLQGRAPVFASPLFKAGYFEMQDAGSQVIALLAEAKPGQRVIDFCAGAGGKTLALAAQMQNKGRILALDTSSMRLEQMKPRLKRAGVDNVQIHVITSETDTYLKRHRQTADCVLADVPCSGSGTWRRNPDLKWRLNPSELESLMALQGRILEAAAKLVKPGGKLIYSTCSMLACENEAHIANFLTKNKNFGVVSVKKMWDKIAPVAEREDSPALRLSPHQEGVDGFFAAVFERLPGHHE